MVADGVHVLLGPALVMVLLRTERVEPYLVALLFAGVPDLDRFLFGPLVAGGYLTGPLWVHRGITHSLLVMALFAGLASLVGEPRAGVVGYGSHLVADYLTGHLMLFAPFDVGTYGLGLDWTLGSAVAGVFSGVVLVAGLVVMVHGERVEQLGTRVRYRTWMFGWRFRRRREPVPNGSAVEGTERDGD